MQLYKCVLKNCDKTFRELDEFLEHTRVHETRSEMMYHCHVCNKQFPTLDELGTHQYTHSIDPNTGLSDNRRKKSEWFVLKVISLCQNVPVKFLLMFDCFFACINSAKLNWK